MKGVGRNDPCPCGSGEKYKRCCAGKATRKQTVFTRGLIALIVVLLALAAYGIMTSARSGGSATRLPGRVWSPEHGHYHDVG